ncbi:hypothetical protein LX32DRAFT_330319 [Colletotrichum zoysiae]|uniref:Uncharacterized protein n=1 Tax=Colletotrichum zoysiae TaxID=1216348 RepID=A0AAD9HJU7_9PEZI|nr:hypothetical protein LX32DRAFT_330319 [Colletotrichum zoysiae]
MSTSVKAAESGFIKEAGRDDEVCKRSRGTMDSWRWGRAWETLNEKQPGQARLGWDGLGWTRVGAENRILCRDKIGSEQACCIALLWKSPSPLTVQLVWIALSSFLRVVSNLDDAQLTAIYRHRLCGQPRAVDCKINRLTEPCYAIFGISTSVEE